MSEGTKPMDGDRTGRRLADNPIAIVGMAGLFPMARNYREFWQNVVDGADCTEEVPESRWRLEDYYDADPSAPDKTYSNRGGFVPDVDFSPLEWGLPPKQLDLTSTMQLLSLGVARDVLRDSGAVGAQWYDAATTGCVLGTTGPVPLTHPLAARLSTPVLKEVVRSCGLTTEDAEQIAAKYAEAFTPWEESTFPGLLANVVAGRVANRLGLGGMNSTVDAACAASLSAIRVAIAELVDGRADMMITGGVDTENSIFGFMCFSKTQALSRSSRISPFSDAADGTLLGEGVGMLALRRLSDAERDGNRVYAVIRGLGSSSDGRSNSIYAPLAKGQRLALDRAYADADCAPDSVELFEAHATGTPVGDRTELTALGGLLRESSDEPHFAALGSVKSQIGHTKGAAGTASLMKLAMSLYTKTLPPTINVERTNPAVDFSDAPFYVNVKTRPWIRDPHRPVRRAAASAMGFGGTNFHFVLEEHEQDRAGIETLHRAARAHLWHAGTPQELLELLRSDVASQDGEDVPAAHARIGFVASDEATAQELRKLAAEQLAGALEAEHWTHPRGVFYRQRALPDLKIGALFAGQGSQYLDMGLEAALSNPAVGAAFDAANASFDGASTRLAQVVYPPTLLDPELRQEQEAALRKTEYAQPAIGALSVGQFRHLSSLGLECAGFLGHSFGELTALWASGAIADADFFRLARARGESMAPPAADADSGAMAAVQAGRAQVGELLADFPGVVVCNINAPDQVVVGGPTAQVEAFVVASAKQGMPSRLLSVAAAFHTSHVAHAVEKFRPAVESVRIGEPAAPVYANSPGAKYGADADSNAATLVRQLLEPVEFAEAVQAMHADGCTVFVEFGPKQVLTQLVQRTLADQQVIAIPTDGGPLGDSDVALTQAAVRLAVLGAPLKGINDRLAADFDEVEPTGMTVPISAAEHVPAERRAAYQAGLTDGFRVSALDHATTDDQHEVHEREQMNEQAAFAQPHHVPARPSLPDGDGAVHQHVALHTQYLDGQLQIAEALTGLLRDHQQWDRHDSRLPEVVESVKNQSVAISQAHARANEVLAELTVLELGGQRPENRTTVFAEATTVEAPEQRALTAPEQLPTTPAPQPVAPAPAPEPVAVQEEPVAESPASGGADAASVRTALLEVVSEKTGYPVEMVDPAMDLESDLGVDSIKRVQILGVLQERFPELPAVGPEQLGELRTLDQISGFLVADAGDADPKAQVG
ncbi:acyltransferase domain-containing protein [Saccharopolyspora indica]|uniref:beta-ketoacyl synthase N-terminal-like domain-containing protein n=1 Tax=Saccharopolyspora indica TaxID=1229659 RepID=UPI0022EB149B|nr:beta-ketoacyl synthase N-terminal-like domain-containing protein [Saccharopolyspora indica]MDA3648383.1 beta-ketoacyl synthase N-terminal-like domain-containing protein [Saccharopolyspora indica]